MFSLLLAGFALVGMAVAAPPFPIYPREINNTSPDNLGDYTFEQLWELENVFWTNFVYPNNLKQANMIVSDLFAPNVQGRVDISRTFDGAELNTEYLFGLFSDPTRISVVGIPKTYKITSFVANKFMAAATTVVQFDNAAMGTSLPITIDTFIAWDKAGKIIQYDGTWRWFGYLLDTVVKAAGARYNAINFDQAQSMVAATLAESVCSTHESHCTGANQQYTNKAACKEFLLQQRFGESYELGRNTLLCRVVHEQMARRRPEVHCPHIGPSGGGMCDDSQSYVEKVDEVHFTNAPFIPFGYPLASDKASAVWTH